MSFLLSQRWGLKPSVGRLQSALLRNPVRTMSLEPVGGISHVASSAVLPFLAVCAIIAIMAQGRRTTRRVGAQTAIGR